MHVVNYMILICLHPVLLTLCCFSANFLNGFDNDFSSDYVTYYRLLHMHIMHCILDALLPGYIYFLFPHCTFTVFLFLRIAFVMRAFLVLARDLFE